MDNDINEIELKVWLYAFLIATVITLILIPLRFACIINFAWYIILMPFAAIIGIACIIIIIMVCALIILKLAKAVKRYWNK